MRYGNAVAILIPLMLVVGCAEKQQVKVTFLSDPPGGTLYTLDGDLRGPCPTPLWYELNEEAIAGGYLDAQGMMVRWPGGPEKKSGRLIRITVNGTDRYVTFLQPKDEPKIPVDAGSGQKNKTPDNKQAKWQDRKKMQSADPERIRATLALNSKKPTVAGRPSESQAGEILTLSKRQLILLDWHRSNRGGARVEGKRPAGGAGVEFGIYFPSNSPGSCSLSFVSTGAGGRGSLVGSNIRGYGVFALKLTLVSINGQSDPALEQKLVVGAVIGPTPEGRMTGYEPFTLSLAGSEKTITVRTPMSADEIYEIGFHVHALNHDNWDPSGSRVVLRAEPAEAGQAGPFTSFK